MSPPPHITNGDAAVPRLRAVLGAGAAILPWRDILHDGPVPGGLGLAELSAVRAAYLAGCGYAPLPSVLAQFRDRDARIAALAADAPVTIWLEHDLVDQLQLVQLLDLAAAGTLPRRGLLLAQADDYLSDMSPDALAALGRRAAPVGEAQLALARRAWIAFTAPTPEPLAALLEDDLAPLPFLRASLERLLEELPAPRDGLNRIERAVLAALAAGPASPNELFRRVAAAEEPRWLGDLPFFRRLDALAAAPLPLIEGEAPGRARHALHAPLSLTPAGDDVLAGLRDRARASPPERWLGGTYLGATPVWRWDPRARGLTRE